METNGKIVTEGVTPSKLRQIVQQYREKTAKETQEKLLKIYKRIDEEMVMAAQRGYISIQFNIEDYGIPLELVNSVVEHFREKGFRVAGKKGTYQFYEIDWAEQFKPALYNSPSPTEND